MHIRLWLILTEGVAVPMFHSVRHIQQSILHTYYGHAEISLLYLNVLLALELHTLVCQTSFPLVLIGFIFPTVDIVFIQSIITNITMYLTAHMSVLVVKQNQDYADLFSRVFRTWN